MYLFGEYSLLGTTPQIVWGGRRWMAYDTASNTVSFPLPRRFRTIPSLKVACVWQMVWVILNQIYQDLQQDDTQSWPYLPHHRMVWTQLKLADWMDSVGWIFCLQDILVPWH